MTALAIVNNHISLTMLRCDLAARGIAEANTTIIAMRAIDIERDAFAEVLVYPAAPEAGMLGQRKFLGFYRKAAQIARDALADPALEHLYVVNNDNIINIHLLEVALRRDMEVTVVAEGLMNYLEVGIHNRDGWRLHVAPIMSRVLGLRYASPVGHLSGAYHPAVSRVVSFSEKGLRAPEEKVVVRRWPIAPDNPVQAEPDVGMVVHTSLARLMPSEKYRVFAEGYARWIGDQGFRRLYAKRHPRSSDPLLESLLPAHELIHDDRPLEEMAADLEAGVIIGPGTTPLVTLKLIRPELRCIDFGADYYMPIVYRENNGAAKLFETAGVEQVSFTSAAV